MFRVGKDKKRIPYHYEIPLGLLRGIYSNSTNKSLSATREVSRLTTIVISSHSHVTLVGAMLFIIVNSRLVLMAISNVTISLVMLSTLVCYVYLWMCIVEMTIIIAITIKRLVLTIVFFITISPIFKC